MSFNIGRSPALFQLHLWGGLLIFCGFVVYDTQAIIEKRRRGDKDAIRHSLDLFIDFIQLFRKILILLMQKVSCIFISLAGGVQARCSVVKYHLKVSSVARLPERCKTFFDIPTPQSQNTYVM